MAERHRTGVLDTCTYIDLDLLEPERLPMLPALTAISLAELQHGVAMALATEPKQLLMDEPAAGLNPVETEHMGHLIEDLSSRYKISTRTLQRYFEATTSITSKQALQILRIRKAVEKLANSPGDFHYTQFGYYDYSHFHKHLKQFLCSHTVDIIQPHLKLLQK